MGEPPSIAGRVLAEKYLLIERLGEGGFGSIWRAEHQVLKSPIAVKLIDLEMARREGAVERFLREAQATAALRSPHVVQVLDYGLDRRIESEGQPEVEQPFIVMELLEGENLAERIARIGALSPLEVVRVVTHVARAMSRAHELGIVHRDLKPENIFLVSNGDEEVAKVLDFGVAKFASPMDLNGDTYTQTGSLVGTPYYMSPEQAQGNKTVDYRSDLWALGVIAFEMLTGKRPFDSEALGDLVLCICVRDIPVPSQFGPVPAGFDDWFARATARDPEQRFQSARELALSLLELVESGDGEVRYTQFDDRQSLRPNAARNLTRSVDSTYVADIPSRPLHSAFAATVRDVVTTSSGLTESSYSALEPSATSDNTIDEKLSPASLAGMAMLALAAGAAAVYGLFYLLRDPDTSNRSVVVEPSSAYHDDATTGQNARLKHKGDVSAPHPPTSVSAPGSGPNGIGRGNRSNEDVSKIPAATAVGITPGAELPEAPGAAYPPNLSPSPTDTQNPNVAASPTATTDPSSGQGAKAVVSPAADSPKDNPSAATDPKAQQEHHAPGVQPIDALPMVTNPD